MLLAKVLNQQEDVQDTTEENAVSLIQQRLKAGHVLCMLPDGVRFIEGEEAEKFPVVFNSSFQLHYYSRIKGSYNEFTDVSAESFWNALIIEQYSINVYNYFARICVWLLGNSSNLKTPSLAFRRSLDDVNPTEAALEAYYVAFASQTGLGPELYAIAQLRTGHVLYIMQSGMDLGKYIRYHLRVSYSIMANKLVSLCTESGTLGFLLLDAKLGNVIVINEFSDDPQVKMIDFGSDYCARYTVVETHHQECIEFFNLLALTMFTSTYLPEYELLRPLCVRLWELKTACDNCTSSPLCEALDSLYFCKLERVNVQLEDGQTKLSRKLVVNDKNYHQVNIDEWISKNNPKKLGILSNYTLQQVVYNMLYMVFFYNSEFFPQFSHLHEDGSLISQMLEYLMPRPSYMPPRRQKSDRVYAPKLRFSSMSNATFAQFEKTNAGIQDLMDVQAEQEFRASQSSYNTCYDSEDL